MKKTVFHSISQLFHHHVPDPTQRKSLKNSTFGLTFHRKYYSLIRFQRPDLHILLFLSLASFFPAAALTTRSKANLQRSLKSVIKMFALQQLHERRKFPLKCKFIHVAVQRRSGKFSTGSYHWRFLSLTRSGTRIFLLGCQRRCASNEFLVGKWTIPSLINLTSPLAGAPSALQFPPLPRSHQAIQSIFPMQSANIHQSVSASASLHTEIVGGANGSESREMVKINSTKSSFYSKYITQS